MFSFQECLFLGEFIILSFPKPIMNSEKVFVTINDTEISVSLAKSLEQAID